MRFLWGVWGGFWGHQHSSQTWHFCLWRESMQNSLFFTLQRRRMDTHLWSMKKRGMVPKCTFVMEHFWFLSSPIAMQGIIDDSNELYWSLLSNQRVVENYSVKLYMIEHVAATLPWDNSSKWKLLQQYCLSCPCFTFKIGIMIFRNKIFTDLIFFLAL